ncbi:MAG: hydroxyacid dehydrogenase [Verrucomicrobia bacterium]|nr:hydroxyacid dehydrogenase [Verrucomicrobiota bacterium]
MELSGMPARVTLNSTGERLQGDNLVRYLADADAAILGLEKINAEVLERCPRIKLIAKYGVGLDNLDLDACRKRGVAVGWTPGVNRHAVAEQTIGCLISLARNLHGSNRKLQHGVWEKAGGRQVSGMIVGIIGLGCVGAELLRLLQPFVCAVLVNDIVDVQTICDQYGAVPASKEEIYARADAVTLHVPLTAETRQMINSSTLRQMKRSAFLINTARGEIVDQSALKHALRHGIIAGAAIDVYGSEPPADLDFLKFPNLLCTPHIAGNSQEAVLAMGQSALVHVRRFFGFGSASLRDESNLPFLNIAA